MVQHLTMNLFFRKTCLPKCPGCAKWHIAGDDYSEKNLMILAPSHLGPRRLREQPCLTFVRIPKTSNRRLLMGIWEFINAPLGVRSTPRRTTKNDLREYTTCHMIIVVFELLVFRCEMARMTIL